jgi:hypothetical protein
MLPVLLQNWKENDFLKNNEKLKYYVQKVRHVVSCKILTLLVGKPQHGPV